MLSMYLYAIENNDNIYHPSHGYASIVFRLGSGAGRRSTTTARTPNYRARLWLLIVMAKFCYGTHVTDHPEAADGVFTTPTSALRGDTHVAPTTPPVTSPDIHYVHILQWPQATTARHWVYLRCLCAVIWVLMMDHGNIGGFQTGPDGIQMVVLHFNNGCALFQLG